jgi:hypothetical protein
MSSYQTSHMYETIQYLWLFNRRENARERHYQQINSILTNFTKHLKS